jgi:hypothetical protein
MNPVSTPTGGPAGRQHQVRVGVAAEAVGGLEEGHVIAA